MAIWPELSLVAGEAVAAALGADAGVSAELSHPNDVLIGGKKVAGILPEASTGRVALGDVYPENGELVLSLHYQEGLTVSPSRVKIERYEDPTGRDPIPLVRLKVDAPVARLTLTWRR